MVTLKSLQGTSIEDYGYQLGRKWQIGQKGKNNGVLLIVAPNERKVRIEVGYGLEGTLTDAIGSFIIQNSILPRFRAGDYAGRRQARGGGHRAGAVRRRRGIQGARRARDRRVRSSNGDALVMLIFLIIAAHHRHECDRRRASVCVLRAANGKRGRWIDNIPIIIGSGSGGAAAGRRAVRRAAADSPAAAVRSAAAVRRGAGDA